jgi:hypothetical protein
LQSHDGKNPTTAAQDSRGNLRDYKIQSDIKVIFLVKIYHFFSIRINVPRETFSKTLSSIKFIINAKSTIGNRETLTKNIKNKKIVCNVYYLSIFVILKLKHEAGL